ncbi:tol-pal system protein YbgF [Thermovibrio ammonificans]
MKKAVFAALFTAAVLAGCAPQQGAKTDFNQLEAQIQALKAQVEGNQRRLSSVEERVSKLEDKTASNEQQIFDLKKECENVKQTLSQISVSSAPSAPVGGSSSTQTVVQFGAKDLYRQAFDAMEAGNFDKAQQLFEQLVQQYPDSDLADNALYWIGEIYYSHNDYQTAANYFQQVIDKYPNGNKVPAAMLKLALCYRGMGNTQKAKEILKEVIDKYPGTPEASIAKVKLMELEQ